MCGEAFRKETQLLFFQIVAWGSHPQQARVRVGHQQANRPSRANTSVAVSVTAIHLSSLGNPRRSKRKGRQEERVRESGRGRGRRLP